MDAPSSGHGLLYKRVLDDATVHAVAAELEQICSTIIEGGLASGRQRTEGCFLSEGLQEEIAKQISTSIAPYFGGEVSIGDLRLYQQNFGAIKPHYDATQHLACMGLPHSYSLLVYLSDGFEGGELCVKCPRTALDPEPALEPTKRHRVYTFEPRVGHGILFSKRYLHWANEVYGCKIILLTDLASTFPLEKES